MERERETAKDKSVVKWRVWCILTTPVTDTSRRGQPQGSHVAYSHWMFYVGVS